MYTVRQKPLNTSDLLMSCWEVTVSGLPNGARCDARVHGSGGTVEASATPMSLSSLDDKMTRVEAKLDAVLARLEALSH